MSRFHAVYDKLNQALEGMPYDELGISVEVKEQVNSSTCFFFFFFWSDPLVLEVKISTMRVTCNA
jgi:hypothetical protein